MTERGRDMGNAEEPRRSSGYDPELRRDTPLAARLEARIRDRGPLSLSSYMDACLNDPEHGYYRHRAAIGRAGDFVTAPEISQTFGELIGLWCAVVWQQLGEPASFQLVELGPGRGTLMADALRAARLVRGFLKAAEVVLVESNSILGEVQRRALATHDVPMRWVETTDAIEARQQAAIGRPTIVIANEFLDTVPVYQFKRLDRGWRERLVGLDDAGRIAFLDPAHAQAVPARSGAALAVALEARFLAARTGELITVADYGKAIDRWLIPAGASPAEQPATAALIIDYGEFEGGVGDTLQALRSHRYEHPLTSPGEADLSALVDFRELARHAAASGFAVDGPVTQATFLGRLGIVERASRLMSANPASAAAIEAGVARLIAPNAMGGRFKAIGLRSRNLPPLPGFS